MPLLAARAITFRQQALLALSLSWVAGYVNVAVIALCGTTVSHVTGNVTTFGLHLAELLGGRGGVITTLFLLHLPVGFLLGATASQCLVRFAEHVGLARPAMLSVAVEAVLLSALSVSLARFGEAKSTAWLWAATSIGTVAMGLQNATMTRISGSVVRTTHLTGVVTDLGTESVDLLLWMTARLRGCGHARLWRVITVLRRQQEAKRIVLLLAITASFFTGAAGGAFVLMNWPGASVWPAVLFLIFTLAIDAVRLRAFDRHNGR